MPIYIYSCRSCGAERELVRSVSEHTRSIECECGDQMPQLITPLRVIPDIQPYRSMVTGERIGGRAQHRQHLRQHNLIEVGDQRMERKEKPLPPVGPDIKQAIEELRSR